MLLEGVKVPKTEYMRWGVAFGITPEVGFGDTDAAG
jgi:hypothetical protein